VIGHDKGGDAAHHHEDRREQRALALEQQGDARQEGGSAYSDRSLMPWPLGTARTGPARPAPSGTVCNLSRYVAG
jgi:hypothetical protein